MVLLYLGPLSQLAGRAVWGNKSRVESLPEEDNKKMLLPLFSRLICSQKDIKSSIILHHKVMSPWAVWPTENISLCATAAFGHIPFRYLTLQSSCLSNCSYVSRIPDLWTNLWCSSNLTTCCWRWGVGTRARHPTPNQDTEHESYFWLCPRHPFFCFFSAICHLCVSRVQRVRAESLCLDMGIQVLAQEAPGFVCNFICFRGELVNFLYVSVLTAVLPQTFLNPKLCLGDGFYCCYFYWFSLLLFLSKGAYDQISFNPSRTGTKQLL